MAPSRRPPPNLSRFPGHRLPSGRSLYRIHQAKHEPWWFASSASGRFDLMLPEGTCYLAEAPLGALLEMCRGQRCLPYSVIRERRLSVVRAQKDLVLADCTAARAAGFGVTGAIHSTDDYGLSRAWAQAFARAGFRGIRYLLSHDPRLRLVGYAVFGPAGVRRWPVRASAEIPDELVEKLQDRFGILTIRHRPDRV